ncbi:hypothetical protein [Streptomyces sp. NRRL F-2664]|uniref:hypothetical protein n=1 Tax=Streptomyces sp. NRRL F-2664 TaxID=1463842 RepID=UPI0004C77244|nr:hypothetical protein [Streptomyces sp. NRRL F-2664]
MHLTRTATDTDLPGEGREDDCERVSRVLARAGFETSTPGEDGLRVWATPEGVVVGWVAREVLRPTVQIHGHEEDIGRLTSLTGLHEALRTALAVVLREAGLDAAVHEEHLVVVRRSAPDATGAGSDRLGRARTHAD